MFKKSAVKGTLKKIAICVIDVVTDLIALIITHILIHTFYVKEETK